MSITDELREAINQLRVECEEKEGCGVLWYPEPPRDRFSEIADRIDEAFKEMSDCWSLEYLQLNDMAFGFWERLKEVAEENAKLREELAKARDPQRIGGQADPSSFVYAIEQLREFRWQHATNDEDAIPYINNVAAAHERENAKLRELCRHLYMCNQYCDREDSNGGCSACPYQLLEYDCGFEERLLKLGIEVDA